MYFYNLILCFPCIRFFYFLFKNVFKRFYLFLERGEGREKERGRNINVWLSAACLSPGTWPTVQARALTGTRTGEPLARRLALNLLSHTSQGCILLFKKSLLVFSFLPSFKTDFEFFEFFPPIVWTLDILFLFFSVVIFTF